MKIQEETYPIRFGKLKNIAKIAYPDSSFEYRPVSFFAQAPNQRVLNSIGTATIKSLLRKGR